MQLITKLKFIFFILITIHKINGSNVTNDICRFKILSVNNGEIIVGDYDRIVKVREDSFEIVSLNGLGLVRSMISLENNSFLVCSNTTLCQVLIKNETYNKVSLMKDRSFADEQLLSADSPFSFKNVITYFQQKKIGSNILRVVYDYKNNSFQEIMSSKLPQDSLLRPIFKHFFVYGQFLYILWNDCEVPYNDNNKFQQCNSYIGQLCLNDMGIRGGEDRVRIISTFKKTILNCFDYDEMGRSNTYNTLEKMTKLDNLVVGEKKKQNIDNDYFYAAFSNNYGGSAICKFTMKKIEEIFHTSRFIGMPKFEPILSCLKLASMSQIELGDYITKIRGGSTKFKLDQIVSEKAMHVVKNQIVKSIVFFDGSFYGYYPSLFIGTKSSKIFMISLNGNFKKEVYSRPIDDDFINDLILIKTKSSLLPDYLIALSVTSIIRIPVIFEEQTDTSTAMKTTMEDTSTAMKTTMEDASTAMKTTMEDASTAMKTTMETTMEDTSTAMEDTSTAMEDASTAMEDASTTIVETSKNRPKNLLPLLLLLIVVSSFFFYLIIFIICVACPRIFESILGVVCWNGRLSPRISDSLPYSNGEELIRFINNRDNI